MYTPPHYVVEDSVEIEEIVRANAFAALISAGDDGTPTATPLPSVLEGGVNGRLTGHFARANPH